MPLAALHEAGHVLGLPHNPDPASPMHAHGIPGSTIPAAVLSVPNTTPVLNDDGGTDDSPSDAPRIEPYTDSALRRASRTIGSISTARDADYFRFRSPKPPSGKTFGMLVQIESLQRDQLIPRVAVLDEQQLALDR